MTPTFVLLFSLLGLQAPIDLRQGELAPPLALDGLLQAPDGTHVTWEALRGRAVVLEFWATWCGGCVENIPHLNELAGEFKDRPVVFISITDEELSIVNRFLRKHVIAGWIALDAEAATFRAYGVEGRPQTFLIDGKGVIRAITSPNSVTVQVLDDLLAGKTLDFPEAKGSPVIGSEPSAPTPFLQVLIRPAAPAAVTGMSPGAERRVGGRFEAWGLPLIEILSRAYDVPPKRIEAPEWAGQTKYDLTVLTPKGSDSDEWPLVRQMLAPTFHLKLRRENRETAIYLLRKLPGQEPRLKAAATRGRSGVRNLERGELEAIATLPGLVAEVAQDVLDCPVFDETTIKERYDFELKWNSKQPPSFITAVREQLGLELAPARRALEYLVVESADEPTTW